MSEKTFTQIKFPNIRSEAQRLNALGALRVTYDVSTKTEDRRDKPLKCRVIGFAIDADERDCLLLLGPYGASGRFTVRCVPAAAITEIEVLGGRSVPLMPGTP